MQFPRSTEALLDEYWPRIVEYYTRCELTNSSDRCVAILGIVICIKNRLPEDVDYVAGLWSNKLLQLLLWTTDDATYPSTYRGPSWSWVALESGRISYAAVIPESQVLKYTAEVLERRVFSSDGAYYGRVTFALLRVRVMLYPCKLKNAGARDPELDLAAEADGTRRNCSGLSSRRYWDFRWDSGLDRPSAVFVMPVMERVLQTISVTERGRCSCKEHFTVFALLLQLPLPRDDVFSRVRLLEMSNFQLPEVLHGEERIINLV